MRFPHYPNYKGGRFLFDLLDLEDFMLDGQPRDCAGSAEFQRLLLLLA
jgi:hypothetical protein